MTFAGLQTGDFSTGGGEPGHFGADQNLDAFFARHAGQGIGSHGCIKETVIRAPARSEDAVQVQIRDNLANFVRIGPIFGLVAGCQG